MPNNADPTAGIVGNNSAGASDTASGSGAMNPDDLAKMINDAVSKAIGARMKRERSTLEEQIAAAVEKTLASRIMNATAEGAAPVARPAEDDEPKLNLKSLDSRFKSLQDEIAKERKARQEAEQRATQTQINAKLAATFAKHAGQDNPHLPLYIKEYAAQFKADGEQVYRVVRNEMGDEELVPLEQAASDMFAGELKHLVPAPAAQSRGGLPTSAVRGMPLVNTAGAPKRGLFEEEILHHQAMTDPALYASLYGPKK